MSRIVHLDCDTGIDDAVALLYLLADPGVELVGVTTVAGNVPARRAAANTAALLQLAGRSSVAVAVGAEAPLVTPYDGGFAEVHGADGVGDVGLAPATDRDVQGRGAELIVALARRHAGRLDLVATGPLTNLALAVRIEPRVAQWVRSVTVMGGAAVVPGNVTPVAEANVYTDPEAAATVLTAPWPLTLVPLDVTMEHVIEEPDRRALLSAASPLAVQAGRVLAHYFEFYRDVFGRPCAPCHDALAAAVAIGAVEVVQAPHVRVAVDHGYGPGRGQTICDLRGCFNGFPPQDGANCRVVLRLAEPFVPHLLSRLDGAPMRTAAA